MLITNNPETTRALRTNSVTRIGRHNDYKQDPDCIHIGDLKVPKKYISIIVGKTASTSDSKTPLSIKFESICKTTLNGELYRLASREDDPFTKEFTEETLSLTVNSNKNNRIQIIIKWVPIYIMPFSKKIEYKGEIQLSPLPSLLVDMHSNGTDLRICSDPFLATHYLTLSDHADYAFQIAVLRSIPVVTTSWTDFMQREPNSVKRWLLHPDSDFFLPNTPNNFAYPDSRRASLLSNKSVLICYLEPLKHLLRLKDWVKCLGCTEILLFDLSSPISTISEILSGSKSNATYAFSVNGSESLCKEILKKELNTYKDLWESVISLRVLNLKLFETPIELGDIILKQEDSTPKFSERRKRRKVQRVSETDFFQFSHPPSSLPAEDADSLIINEITDQAAAPSQENLQQPNQKFPDSVPDETDKGVQKPSLTLTSPCKTSDSENKCHLSNKISKDSKIHENLLDEKIDVKRVKIDENSNWIVPQVSLAEAIRTAKGVSEKNFKVESLVDIVDNELQNFVLVEEIDLVVPKKQNCTAVADPKYKNRPNFKAFKKKTNTTSNLTRTYLELFNDNLLSEVRFVNGEEDSRKLAPQKIEEDFKLEMDDVNGYRPKVSQLFVNEASDESDTGSVEEEDVSFTFLNRAKPRDSNAGYCGKYSHEVDHDDEFTFAFSRN